MRISKTIIGLVITTFTINKIDASPGTKVQFNHDFPELVSSVEYVVDGHILSVSNEFKEEKGKCKVEAVKAFASRSTYSIESSNKVINDYKNKTLTVVDYSPGLLKNESDSSGEHLLVKCHFESEGFFNPTRPFDEKSKAFLRALGFQFH